MVCREVISSIFIGYLMLALFHSVAISNEKEELRGLISKIRSCQTYEK